MNLKQITILIISLTLLSGCKKPSRPSSQISNNTSSSQISSSKDNSNNKLSSSSISSNNSSNIYSSKNNSIDKENKKTFKIFPFNDVHGSVSDTSSNIGISKTSSYLKSFDAEHSILISQGDMWQGSSESNNTKGKLVTEWMNNMNFVSMTLGNHEFDWGSQYIRENSDLASFPFLAINIIDNNTGKNPGYCSSSVTFTRDNIKFGVIGAIGNCKSSISSSFVQDVDFIVGKNLDNLVIKEAKRLKNEENVDFIIYSIHDAYIESGDFTQSFNPEVSSYVDLYLEGHSHSLYSKIDSKGKWHVQTGANNNSISEITINFDSSTHEYNIEDPSFSYSSLLGSKYNLQNDEETEALFTKYKNEIGDVDSPLGYNKYYRKGEMLNQLVASLYLKKGKEKWESDYEITLAGGLIYSRSPYNLNSGEVTMRMIQQLFPFENDVVLCKIGKDSLEKNFINSTNKKYAISYNGDKETITSSLTSSKSYYIITDTYSLDYAPNKLTYVDKLGENIYAYTLLGDYIASGGLNK